MGENESDWAKPLGPKDHWIGRCPGHLVDLSVLVSPMCQLDLGLELFGQNPAEQSLR